LAGLGTIPNLLDRLQPGGWRPAQLFLFELESREKNAEEWGLAQRIAAQQDILGTSVEAHPLELLSPTRLDALNPLLIAEALARPGEIVQVLGIRQTLQRFFLAGEMRYVLELEDLTGVLPVVFSPKLYRRYQRELNTRAPLLVLGEIQHDSIWVEGVLVAQQVESLLLD
jgi:error-prone DNA polymerase